MIDIETQMFLLRLVTYIFCHALVLIFAVRFMDWLIKNGRGE